MIRLQREGCFGSALICGARVGDPQLRLIEPRSDVSAEKISRIGNRGGLAALDAKIAQKCAGENDANEADVNRPDVRSENKLDLVLTRRQMNPAHDEVATKEFGGSAVHNHLPIGIVLIIQQEHGRGVGACLKNGVFRRITFDFDGAFSVVC